MEFQKINKYLKFEFGKDKNVIPPHIKQMYDARELITNNVTVVNLEGIEENILSRKYLQAVSIYKLLQLHL